MEQLAQTPLPEDAGAETQARFRYQHECTACSCFAMLAETTVAAVVCEHHEDFVVIHADNGLELVSVKHRENSQGPWSFASLCKTGGVLHLYSRWLATGRRAKCRVMTNAGLKPGSLEAQAFANACRTRERARISPFLTALAAALDAPEIDGAAEFALSLTIDSDLPGRRHMGAVNLREMVVPTLEKLGASPKLAESCYEEVLEVIARANRDEAAERGELLEILSDPRGFDQASQNRRRVRRRAITRDALMSVLQGVSSSSTTLAGTSDGATEAPAPSRLQQKLDAGGLGPTAIDSAIRLRAGWYVFESTRRATVPGGDPAFEDLRVRVQDLAGLSESRVKEPGPYGRQMHLDLRNTVTVENLAVTPPFDLDDQLLQGLVFQLTDECKVWFSEPFELDKT
jgi:Cap4 dsDNA endonuclease